MWSNSSYRTLVSPHRRSHFRGIEPWAGREERFAHAPRDGSGNRVPGGRPGTQTNPHSRQSGYSAGANQREVKRGIIHGDFSAAHVVLNGQNASSVIDVMGEFYIPGWELMRGFFQSVPCGTDRHPEALEALWRSYLSGYLSEQWVRRARPCHPLRCCSALPQGHLRSHRDSHRQHPQHDGQNHH